MTTLTIDNPVIEKRYSSYEIKMKFIDFLENDLKEKRVNLYKITVADLPEKTKKRFDNIDSLNFVDY